MATYADEIARTVKKLDSGVLPICMPWMFGSMTLVYLHVYGHDELIAEMLPESLHLRGIAAYNMFSDFVRWLLEQDAEDGEWFVSANVFEKFNEFVAQREEVEQ